VIIVNVTVPPTMMSS